MFYTQFLLDFLSSWMGTKIKTKCNWFGQQLCGKLN